MAKTTGPLFSMDASGKFGGALVFGKWKGRNVVRQLVTPANPQSADQEASRNAVRCFGEAQRQMNLSAEVHAGDTATDKALFTAAAPSGQAWNGYLVKSGIGSNQIHYDAATVAYAALTAPQKAAWVAGADALVPAILGVAQTAAGGVPAAALTSGEVFFHKCYARYVAGLDLAAPGAVPPDYS